MATGTPDIKYGFYVGLGLLLAFLIWGFATQLLGRARRSANG